MRARVEYWATFSTGTALGLLIWFCIRASLGA